MIKKEVYVLTPEERSHRQLVRTRRQMVNHRSAVAHQIQSLLLFHGIKSPFPEDKRWSKVYMCWLRDLELPFEELTISLRYLVSLYDQLGFYVEKLTKQVKALSETEKYCGSVALLDSIPGIGWLSAIEIVVEVQDFKRFETPEQLSSFVGVVPSEHTSDDKSSKGGITHMGNSHVRTVLIEDSWVLIKQDEHWRQKYLSIKYRRGGYKAIVAISRKLLEVIWAMFQTGELYHRKAA
jgi:transposase